MILEAVSTFIFITVWKKSKILATWKKSHRQPIYSKKIKSIFSIFESADLCSRLFFAAS
jgi:hypothetical protein